MTTFIGVLCLLVLLVLLVLVAFSLVTQRSDGRAALLIRFVSEQHEANITMLERLQEWSAQFTDNVNAAALRETDDLRLVLNALVDDRQRLVTALLANGPNPQAARTVAMVDAAVNRTTDREAWMRELHERAAADGRASEFVDADGNAIVPVGMGSAL